MLTLTTFALVFGTMWLAAKYLSTILPSGFWYSALAAILCAIAAPLIGFGVGIIMSGTGGKVGDHLLSGVTTGLLAAIVAPLAVAFYRRKATTA